MAGAQVEPRPSPSPASPAETPGAATPRLRAILDSLLDPHVLLTAVRDEAGEIVDFVFADANQAACDFNGLPYDRLVGTRLLTHHPAAGPSGLLSLYEQVVRTAEPLILEDWAYPQDLLGGEIRRYDVRCVRVADGLTQTWRDVTERHEAQEALRRSEEDYRLLAENAADLIVRITPDRVITWASPSATRSLGWSPDELENRPIEEFLHPDDVARVGDLRQRLVDGSLAAEIPVPLPLLRVRSKDGRFRWMTGHVSVVGGPRADGAGIVLGMHDIDDLIVARAVADAARRKEERTRVTMDSAAVGMAIIEPGGHFVHVNPALARMLDYEEQHLVGATFATVTHPDDVARGMRAVGELMSGTAEGFTQRKRYLTRTGEAIWVDLSVVAVRRPDGAVDHFVAQLVNVTGEVENAQALEATAARFRLLAENASDVVFDLGLDCGTRWVSGSVTSVLGWTPELLPRGPGLEFVAEEDRERARRLLLESLAGRATSGVVLRFLTADGGSRHMSVLARPITDAEGSITGTVVGLRDVTAEVAAKAALERSERQFRLAMNAAPQGMAIADAEGRFVEVNPSLCALLGLEPAAILNHRVQDFLPGDEQGLAHDVMPALERDKTAVIRHQHHLVAGDRELWVDHSVSVLSDGVTAPLYVHQFVDESEAHLLQAELSHRASHDSLTGVSNRAELMLRLGQRLDRLTAGGGLGLLFCDIDNLKPINDRYGHPVGDAVITAVAQRLTHGVRGVDHVGRVGGDEFVVLLDGVVHPAELARIAGQLQRDVSRPVTAVAHLIELTLSIGAALAAPGDAADDVLARADVALYRAKAEGRDRLCVDERAVGDAP